MVALDGFTDRLDYPMCVVTAAAGDERAGCLVGFASQCSLDPPTFVVWLSRANHTYGVARRASHLGVHLIGREQVGVARLFGSRCGAVVDKFATLSWEPGAGRTPVLTDACAWWVGRVDGHADWGDHVGFHLSPLEAGSDPLPRQAPLRLSDVRDLTPGHSG
ncbi:High molecular weight rubredoxin [Streptomyces sp. YIM 130001]|uniref:flavin reductase family protein n=1 Tax=Streptomyces sp. YIM 130001 TaxID=2259644 RepID=UPI000EC0D8FB|nr:flavin reductase family protein [Streptomyces sp. YIM 130001]RII20448.1 High molecular weight rubredoxin [Streptomyces sp. YIM 130001]